MTSHSTRDLLSKVQVVLEIFCGCQAFSQQPQTLSTRTVLSDSLSSNTHIFILIGSEQLVNSTRMGIGQLQDSMTAKDAQKNRQVQSIIVTPWMLHKFKLSGIVK